MHSAEWISWNEAGAANRAAIHAARDNAVHNVLVIDLLLGIRLKT